MNDAYLKCGKFTEFDIRHIASETLFSHIIRWLLS